MLLSSELFVLQAASVAAAAVFYWLLLLTTIKAPHIIVANLFILFTLAWRTAATLYIDLFGPVYAEQLARYVGPGGVAALHVTIYIVILGMLNLMLSERVLLFFAGRRSEPRPPAATGFTLGDAYFVAGALFIGALYFDLLRIGVVPLLQNMERFVYTNDHSGVFHQFLIKYGNLFCFQLGVAFAYSQIVTGRAQLRFVWLLVALFAYGFLTGNRFSIFYSFGSFFIAPYAATMIGARMRATAGRRSVLATVGGWLSRREIRATLLTLVVAVAFAAYGLYHSHVNVRAYAGQEAVDKFVQRLLVQPSELGWTSFERVFIKGQRTPEQAFDFVFLGGIDPERNTSVQYLMLKTVDLDVVYTHIGGGFQFAGGFPEIFFEVFEPPMAAVVLLLAVFAATLLTGITLVALLRGWLATVFCAAYVLYGFNVMYIGGALHFAMVWTYWAKIAALFIVLILERQGIIRIPWVLVRINRPAYSQAG
jgi:hypothetical protein